jgi:hypothetical protein
VALHRLTLETQRRVFGEEHPHVVFTMKSLADTYCRHDRCEEAAPLYERALELSRRVNGEGHQQTNALRYNLACHAALRGHRDNAISYLREALDHGYDGGVYSWILDDPDLASLRGDPEAEAIALEMKRRREEGATAGPATETE